MAVSLNKNLISDPTVWLPGFDHCHSTWSILNRFRTGQGRCAANLYKWHMASMDKCQCGGDEPHHRVSCPLTRFTDVVCLDFTRWIAQSRGYRMLQ